MKSKKGGKKTYHEIVDETDFGLTCSEIASRMGLQRQWVYMISKLAIRKIWRKQLGRKK